MGDSQMLKSLMTMLCGVLLCGALLAIGSNAAAAVAAMPLPTVALANVQNGAVLRNPVTLQFVVTNMAVKPAGDATPHSGHVHVLIDTTLTADELAYAIPNDAQHLHFGKGQTTATVTLPKGKHTLQLVMGDAGHVPHVPPILSTPVQVTVE
jgi:hypothetical protein